MTNKPQLESGVPANVDAERTILGAVLLESSCLEAVKVSLKPRDFSLDSHQRVAAAMGRLAKQDRAIDLVTLANELARTKEIEAIGGVSYLASLTEGLPRRPIIGEYIAIVKDRSQLRQLIEACRDATTWAQDQSDPAMLIASSLQEKIDKLVLPAADLAKAEVQHFISDVMDELNQEYISRVSPAVPSGNSWFDAKTGGGYRMGKTTLVAARPKVGKTGWAVSSVAYNCKRGTPVSVFSLEMDKSEILKNLIPYVVNVPNIVVNRPWAQTPEQNRLVNEGFGILADWPLRVYDNKIDIDQICWTIDRDADRHGVQLFVGDHLTLIDAPGKDKREKVNEVSGRIREKMKHKKAAFVLLCQLVKVSREYADKAPLPSDIKESGNPGEDAFAVLMLHRGFDKDSSRLSQDAELNLAYVRGGGGSPGMTKGHFDTRRLCFEAAAEIDFENYYD